MIRLFAVSATATWTPSEATAKGRFNPFCVRLGRLLANVKSGWPSTTFPTPTHTGQRPEEAGMGARGGGTRLARRGVTPPDYKKGPPPREVERAKKTGSPGKNPPPRRANFLGG